jgi:hypothetical protein
MQRRTATLLTAPAGLLGFSAPGPGSTAIAREVIR